MIFDFCSYVTFETPEQLEDALKKDGAELMGRAIKVDVSEGYVLLPSLYISLSPSSPPLVSLAKFSF